VTDNSIKYSSFVRALARTADVPCDLCCHRKRCGQERIACRDFHRFVNLRASRNADVDRYPNPGMYNKVFNSEDFPDGSDS
jgi:hypothetical protein